MTNPNVVLWDVEEPLGSACLMAEDNWGVSVVTTARDLASASWSAEVCLVVVGGCTADSLRERLVAARKQFPEALVVGLLRGDEIAATGSVLDLDRVAVQAVEHGPLELASDLLEAGTSERSDSPDRLVGASLAMVLLRSRLAAAARYDATVLLVGETGTGKSAAARAIHEMSPRSVAPFVHVDCAALSPTIVESELFGHEKGAFTGAIGRRAGRFEAAGEGTAFLDEIGEIPNALQIKFLRVLEEREYERVGGCSPQSMQARVIAGTHVDLDQAVRDERFRADLYYRLRVYTLKIPPLRDRPADIPALVAHAMPGICTRLGRELPTLAPTFMARLLSHLWPGNVRELLHALEAVLIRRRRGTLHADALDDVLVAPASSLDWQDSPALAEFPERLRETLVLTGGNVARAARRLGMPRSTARDRIKRLGLSNLVPRD